MFAVKTSSSFAALAALAAGFATVAVGASFLACSSDDTSGGGGPNDAGTDATYLPPTDAAAGQDAAAFDATTGDDDAATDAALGDDANGSVDAGTDAATDAGYTGVVGLLGFTLNRKCSADGPPPYIYSFGFFQETPPTATTSCQTTSAGPSCTLSICTAPAPTATDVPITGINAGTVTISEYETDGGAVGTNPAVTLDLNDAGAYTSLGGPFLNTPSGGTVVLQGTGFSGDGGVGAFSLTIPSPAQPTVTFPGLTVVAAPACGASQTTSFPLTSDLALAWTQGAPGTQLVANVVVVDQADAGVDAGTTTRTLSCTFDQAASAGTIPSAGGLALLASSDGAAVHGVISFDDIGTAQRVDGTVPIRGGINKFGGPSVNFTSTTTR